MTKKRTTTPIEPATTERRHLLGTSLDAFTAFCAEHDLPAYRTKQVYEWVFRKGAQSFEAMTNLSKPLRTMLAEHWTVFAGAIAARQESSDGTIKLLLVWPDAATSECVLIPDEKRRTACVSSQVGCPVGCAFCASGQGGLQRQLSPGEIVEQAMRIRQLCDEAHPLSNVVFMGMGEPLANYGSVLAAVRIINGESGMNIGARKITISTVGLPPQIRKLAKEGLQVNLAISLHAPNDALRKQLIPGAKKILISDLVAAGREFFETTGREVTLEYLLLAGVNDELDHAHQLTKICRQMRCNVNLIRYNPVAALGYERPMSFAAHKFADEMRSRGVNVHVRKSRGMDIDAACGQLRRKGMVRSGQ
jgi:23S rRNA (adenine2503-C2)-methyltransferase